LVDPSANVSCWPLTDRTVPRSKRDTGPGLAPEDVPHAFDRFYLHDRYRSERSVGSGLGLAIVKELIIAMGGAVTATSPPDGGAEFTLSLPEAEPPDLHASTPQAGGRAQSAGSREPSSLP
jgi:K+-sensing histidine kinase KdpD